MNKLKRRIYDIISPAEHGDLASKIFDVFLIALIAVNIALVIADTFENIGAGAKDIFSAVETFSLVFFTAEYILRVWTADFTDEAAGKIKPRVRYVFSFMAVIDLLAILPFYLPFIFPFDLRVLRTVRLLRLFRLLKINRYTNALTAVGEVIRKKAAQLISSMIVVFLLMIIASMLMYNIECEAQPEVFQNAFSGIWWAIATLTTVGYGDIYPVTILGKVLAATIALLGIGLVAVPTGIISAGFVESIDKGGREPEGTAYCPHCGKKLK